MQDFTAISAQHQLVYGIIEGQVEILVDSKVIETMGAGDVFGQSAVVQPEHTRASTAIAKTDCLIAFLDREHFGVLRISPEQVYFGQLDRINR